MVPKDTLNLINLGTPHGATQIKLFVLVHTNHTCIVFGYFVFAGIEVGYSARWIGDLHEYRILHLSVLSAR